VQASTVHTQASLCRIALRNAGLTVRVCLPTANGVPSLVRIVSIWLSHRSPSRASGPIRTPESRMTPVLFWVWVARPASTKTVIRGVQVPSPAVAVRESWAIEVRASACRCPKAGLVPSGRAGNASARRMRACSTIWPSTPGRSPHRRHEVWSRLGCMARYRSQTLWRSRSRERRCLLKISRRRPPMSNRHPVSTVLSTPVAAYLHNSTARSKVIPPAPSASATSGVSRAAREVRMSADAVSGATSRRLAVHSTMERHPSAVDTWRRSSSANTAICTARLRAMTVSVANRVCSRSSVVRLSIPATYHPGVTENDWQR